MIVQPPFHEVPTFNASLPHTVEQDFEILGGGVLSSFKEG